MRTSSSQWFGQELFERAAATDGLNSPMYVAARLAALRAGRDGIDNLLRDNQLDALVTPSYSPAWTIDLVNGDHVLGSSSSHAALAGYPLLVGAVRYGRRTAGRDHVQRYRTE